jgi:hypothetical protein
MLTKYSYKILPAGRMALLVTLFLVLVNIFNNVTTNTPKVTKRIVFWKIQRQCPVLEFLNNL